MCPSILVPNMDKPLGRLGTLTLVLQPVEKKKNSIQNKLSVFWLVEPCSVLVVLFLNLCRIEFQFFPCDFLNACISILQHISQCPN